MPENIETESNHQTNISILSEFELLISLFRHSVEHESTWEHLDGLWTITSQSPLPPESLKCYSDFLTAFNIAYDQPPLEVLKHQLPKIAPKSEIENTAVKYIFAIEDEINRRKNEHRDKYAWFESSWLLAPYLEAEYPEEINPGRIIAEYLTLLFPQGKLDIGQEIIGEFQAPKSIRHGSLLHDLIVRIGAASVESADYSAKVKTSLNVALTSFLNPRDRFILPENITFDDVLDAAMQAPKGFFLSWARGWWLNADFDSPPITTVNLKKLLSSYTIIGSQNLIGNSKSNNKQKYFSLELFWDLVSKCNDDRLWQFDEELQGLLLDIFGKYTNIRQNVFCGVSPLGDIAVGQFFLFTNRSPIVDITFLLSSGFWDFGELYLLPESKDSDGIVDEFNNKQEMYILLFRKAVEEGLSELANALLSLYLFARGFYCTGRFPTGSSLNEVITTGLSLPGNRTLKHTLNALVALSERSFPSDPMAMLSRRFLQQFIPQQAQLHVISGGEKEHTKRNADSETEIRSFLIEKLGKGRWQKLSPESQGYLLSAETIFRKNYVDFGFGIKEFSTIVIPWCKVIEKELAERLTTFYYSEVYRVYVEKTFKTERPSKPTAGWLIRLLNSYERLSPELRRVLDDSTVKIQHEKELMRNLNTLIGHRNNAAHMEPYDSVEFSRFRKMYYEDRLLHKFIDAIE